MDKAETVLSIQHLSVEYSSEEGAVKAVRDVSFELERGKTIGLVGGDRRGKDNHRPGYHGASAGGRRAKVTSGEILFQWG